MYPNNPQPTNPTPVDYLNQIAPQAPKKQNIFMGKPILAAGIIAIVLLLIVIIIGGILSGVIKDTDRLAARLSSTSSTADSSTANIKSSQLRAINSNLKLYLTNTIRDITPILTKEGVNIKSLGKQVTNAESNTDLLATLEDARLNGIYDRTYAREMAYQLDTILTLMLQINNNTGNKDLKSFLTDARTNLEPIQKQFSDFNLATS